MVSATLSLILGLFSWRAAMCVYRSTWGFSSNENTKRTSQNNELPRWKSIIKNSLIKFTKKKSEAKKKAAAKQHQNVEIIAIVSSLSLVLNLIIIMLLCYRSTWHFPTAPYRAISLACPFLGCFCVSLLQIDTQFQLRPQKCFSCFLSWARPNTARPYRNEWRELSQTCMKRKFHQFGTINESDLYTLTPGRTHTESSSRKVNMKEHKNINYLRKFT